MLIEVISILDMSTSMSSLISQTISSYNTFLEKLRMQNSEIFLTLIVFNTQSKIIYEHVNIKSVQNITSQIIITEGESALNDAIGTAITRTQQFIRSLKRKNAPQQVQFFILTSGYDNASKKYSTQQIKEMVTQNEWEFTFVTSNTDAIAAGERLGFKKENITNINNGGKGSCTSQYDASDVIFDASTMQIEENQKII
ncbi:von_Willebrand factor type A domain-containing protein [Hexamita inflata]|uniref:von Willebrand factor type A domain-containing protein n=1 Tax=Hexamita inflata TaxID=28002 RepID=A0AA86QC73_9EUKA|nr:von Willebrand factor type A domain-containing protein [Hexamita inflata]CAI9957832.1 von Willebrand factor type A domain-containing protein [Hexamita inflata]